MALQDDEKSRILLLFLAISAILVTVAVVVLIAIILIGKLAPPPVAVTGPYGLKGRLAPKTSDVGVLLPEKLGAFKRTAIHGSMQYFTANYENGSDKISLNGSQAVSIGAAQADVNQVLKSTGGGFTSRMLGTDPSFLLSAPDTGPARFVWSHDRWFFDAQASSKAALDKFMEAFKY